MRMPSTIAQLEDHAVDLRADQDLVGGDDVAFRLEDDFTRRGDRRRSRVGRRGGFLAGSGVAVAWAGSVGCRTATM